MSLSPKLLPLYLPPAPRPPHLAPPIHTLHLRSVLAGGVSGGHSRRTKNLLNWALGNVSPQLAPVVPLLACSGKIAALPAPSLFLPVTITLTSSLLPLQSSEVGQNFRYHPDEPRSDRSSPTTSTASDDCEHIRCPRASSAPTRTSILPSSRRAWAPVLPPQDP